VQEFMRAAVQIGYGDMYANLRLDEVRSPDPAAGEVIVRVAGSTLNRKDLFALARLTGPGIRRRPPLPHVGGTDAWGTVAAVGEGVDGWHPGDRVLVYPGLYCGRCEWCGRGETSACVAYGVVGEQRWGSHAQFMSVPAGNLEPVPDGMSEEALACAGGSWLTAWRALITVARVRPGETVLVVGASGGVGTGAIAVARLTGCPVIAIVGSPSKLEPVRALGADFVFVADESTAERVRAATAGRGVDVALDCVGGDGWRRTIASLAPLGRMAICGATAGDSPPISIREIYQQHRQILGAPLGTRTEFRELVRSLAGGRLSPVVHAKIPLEAIHEGLRMLESRSFLGKIAVMVA
jgi:NADPH:quinone reductase-like Zn-dependent oxidoreductase